MEPFSIILGIVELIGWSLLFSDEFRYSTGGKHRKQYVVEKGKVSIESFSTEDQKRFKRQVNYAKFTIACLTHMMFEDDGKLSFGEKKEIKRIFFEKKYIMTKEDIEEVKSYIKSTPSINQLVLIRQKYDISIDEYNRTIGLLSILSQSNPMYKPIINRIEKRFIREKEFMY
ncbi:hypothetical protein OAO42_01190 [Candidatus Izimaplasma bacterium]|nr:hypothetical protein [Candidatus Izimaplasma bacterium]